MNCHLQNLSLLYLHHAHLQSTLSPSLTSSTTACQWQNLNECALCQCCCVLVSATCCDALLPKPLPLPLLCHHNVVNWLLLLFDWFLFAFGVAALLPMPCWHCCCITIFAGCCTTIFLIPLFLVAALQCYWCHCWYWLLLSDHHHPLILASFHPLFVCTCGDCILANTAATALAVAVCTELLGMPLVLLLNAIVHFCQLIVAF